MDFTINSTYTLITRQVDDYDTYFINPFDQNGFLINQFTIDVRLDLWNGYPIGIYMPEIRTLNSDYNLVINVTATWLSATDQGYPYVVQGGNSTDFWNAGYINNFEVMSWTPISIVDDRTGIYAVTPYNQGRLASPLVALDANASNTIETDNMQMFNQLLALSRPPQN